MCNFLSFFGSTAQSTGSIAASETVVVKNMARELFHFSYFILIAPRDTNVGLGPSCRGSRDVSHWQPLPVRAVISTRLSSVYQSPGLAIDRGSTAQTFFVFSSFSDIRMLNLACQ